MTEFPCNIRHYDEINNYNPYISFHSFPINCIYSQRHQTQSIASESQVANCPNIGFCVVFPVPLSTYTIYLLAPFTLSHTPGYIFYSLITAHYLMIKGHGRRVLVIWLLYCVEAWAKVTTFFRWHFEIHFNQNISFRRSLSRYPACWFIIYKLAAEYKKINASNNPVCSVPNVIFSRRDHTQIPLKLPLIQDMNIGEWWQVVG